MRVLVVGGGGREHALCWALQRDGCEVACVPGNPGIAECAVVLSGTPDDAAKEWRPDLVVVGPEDPLIDGLADRLREAGFAVFGPGASGARLEGSKAFSKEMMARAGVRTAFGESFTEIEPALIFAKDRFDAGFGVAIKASGAALGKGVVVCSEYKEAEAALIAMLVEKSLGEAGTTVVIEDRLVGFEFSLLTIVSGRNYLSLPVAQDYKRIFDGDLGPNTGGMGTYSPVNKVSAELVQQTERELVAPLVELLANAGIDYRGVLFTGVMVQDGVPYCLEYNVRFGDPETQSILRRLGPGLEGLLLSAAKGEPLAQVQVLENAVVTVVLASKGYPESSSKGDVISLGEMPEGVVVFHAGSAEKDGQLVTNGGRVLAVSAEAEDVESARAFAYQALEKVSFDGMQFRTDIGLSNSTAVV